MTGQFFLQGCGESQIMALNLGLVDYSRGDFDHLGDDRENVRALNRFDFAKRYAKGELATRIEKAARVAAE